MAGKKRAEVKAIWQGDLGFEAFNQSDQSIFIDSPIAEGGPKGPAPMQLLLISLAGCTGMDVVSILKKMRQDITGFEVRIVGDRAEEHPKVYTDIEIEFLVRGRNLDPKMVERAIELSEERYCSVSAGLKPKASINSRYRIIEEDSV